jgi:hypothetical protein
MDLMDRHMRSSVSVIVLTAAISGCSKSSVKQDRSAPDKVFTAPERAETTASKENAGLQNLTPSKAKAYALTPDGSVGHLPKGVGIAVGQRAPDFTVLDTSRNSVTLEELVRGGKVMLFFYRGGW